MTSEEKFLVMQTLEMIELKLTTESNSCEFEYYLKLKKELQDKLKE